MIKTIRQGIKKYPGWTAMSCGAVVLTGSFFLHCVYGEIFPSIEYARNVIFILAGIGACYGLHMRTEQLKLGKKTQTEENISRAVKQTDSESLPIRCVGVRLLQSVVNENPEKTQIVTDILMHFVEGRCPIKVDEDMKASEEDVSEMHELDDPDRPYWPDPIDRRECKDVEIALRVLGEIVPEEKRKEIEFSELDFRGFDLHEVNFSEFSFSKMRLIRSNFLDADLRRTKFVDCYMEQVNLTSTKLQKAFFRRINFKDTVFFAAIFEETDCSQCDFSQIDHGLFFSPEGTMSRKIIKKTVQEQFNGMIYDCRICNEYGMLDPPKLPPDIDLPENGAYELDMVISDEGFDFFRKLINSGKRLDPV